MFPGRVVYLESLQAMSKELDELQLSLKTTSMLQSHIPDVMPTGMDSTALGRVVPMHFNLHANHDSPKVRPYYHSTPTPYNVITTISYVSYGTVRPYYHSTVVITTFALFLPPVS